MKRPKFIIDQMCGRLAKWLRLMGYDAVYFNDINDEELINIAKREERIILTRDTRLVKRRIIANGYVKALTVSSDMLDVQLKQLVNCFKLKCDKKLERCIECNSELESVLKSETKGKVPPYVYRTQNKFCRCPSCGRYYWRGTHWEKIQAKLEDIC